MANSDSKVPTTVPIGPPAVLNYACLSVFWEPKTSDNKVDHRLASVLLESEDWNAAEQAYRELFIGMLGRTDPWAVFNFSAIVHETRHFHDILQTVWGNQAFAAVFDGILSNLRLFRAMRRAGIEQAPIPIELGDFSELGDLVETAEARVADKRKIQGAGSMVLELLAYWAQAYFVWSTVPDEETFNGYSDLLKAQEQNAMAVALSQWEEAWEAPPWEWPDACYRLLVACLNGSMEPDLTFSEICRNVNPQAMRWPKAKTLIYDEILPELQKVTLGTRLRFEAWLGAIIHDIASDDLLNEEDRRTLVHLLDTFYSARMQMLQLIDKDPGIFDSLVHYVGRMTRGGPHLWMPRVYCHYPDNYPPIKRGLPTCASNDFFWVKAYHMPPRRVERLLGAGPATEVLLHPVPNPFAREGDLMPNVWGAYARDLAGCVAMTEGESLIDPVLRHWSRVSAKKQGLKLVPRNLFVPPTKQAALDANDIPRKQ